MTTEITDAQVLAELREGERTLWDDAGMQQHRQGAAEWFVRTTLRRLALARIEAREAAAREREACAVLVESVPHLDWLATRIRARGGAA